MLLITQKWSLRDGALLHYLSTWLSQGFQLVHSPWISGATNMETVLLNAHIQSSRRFEGLDPTSPCSQYANEPICIITLRDNNGIINYVYCYQIIFMQMG